MVYQGLLNTAFHKFGKSGDSLVAQLDLDLPRSLPCCAQILCGATAIGIAATSPILNGLEPCSESHRADKPRTQFYDEFSKL